MINLKYFSKRIKKNKEKTYYVITIVILIYSYDNFKSLKDGDERSES